eukprot:scaffold739_cov295-Pavlova_lutheri.AAC.9
MDGVSSLTHVLSQQPEVEAASTLPTRVRSHHVATHVERQAERTSGVVALQKIHLRVFLFHGTTLWHVHDLFDGESLGILHGAKQLDPPVGRVAQGERTTRLVRHQHGSLLGSLVPPGGFQATHGDFHQGRGEHLGQSMQLGDGNHLHALLFRHLHSDGGGLLDLGAGLHEPSLVGTGGQYPDGGGPTHGLELRHGRCVPLFLHVLLLLHACTDEFQLARVQLVPGHDVSPFRIVRVSFPSRQSVGHLAPLCLLFVRDVLSDDEDPQGGFVQCHEFSVRFEHVRSFEHVLVHGSGAGEYDGLRVTGHALQLLDRTSHGGADVSGVESFVSASLFDLLYPGVGIASLGRVRFVPVFVLVPRRWFFLLSVPEHLDGSEVGICGPLGRCLRQLRPLSVPFVQHQAQRHVRHVLPSVPRSFEPSRNERFDLDPFWVGKGGSLSTWGFPWGRDGPLPPSFLLRWGSEGKERWGCIRSPPFRPLTRGKGREGRPRDPWGRGSTKDPREKEGRGDGSSRGDPIPLGSTRVPSHTHTNTHAGPSDRGEGIEPGNVDCFLSKTDAKQRVNGGPPPLPWRNPWSIETSLRHARNGQRPAPIGRDR